MKRIKGNRFLGIFVIGAMVLEPLAIVSPDDVYVGGAVSQTLQVQSIFKPILDIVGHEYETQLRVEIAYILVDAWKNEARPWHDRNGGLDEWIAAVKNTPGGKKFPVDLLYVVSEPRKTGSTLEIDVKTGTGTHADKVFTVAAKLGKNGIEDLVKNIQVPGTDKIKVFPKKPDEPDPVKIDLYAKKPVREENRIPEANYRDYTYQRDEKGEYRAEPIGYPGSWELDFSGGFDLVNPNTLNACINRLIKSVATVAGEKGFIEKNTSGHIYLTSDMDKCAGRLSGGRYSEYAGDGIRIFVKDTDNGKELDVFIIPGYFEAKRDFQRERLRKTFEGEKRELDIPAGKGINEEAVPPRGKKRPKVLLFNNIHATRAGEDIKFPVIMLASELKRKGIDVTISDFPVDAYCRLEERARKRSRTGWKPRKLIRLEEKLADTLSGKYDFIGLSIYSHTMEQAKTFTQKLRDIEGDALIAVGGPEASLLPEHSLAQLPNVQCLVRGEGNLIFPDIVNAVAGSGQVLTGKAIADLKGYEGFFLRLGNKVVSSNLNGRNILGRGIYRDVKKYEYEDIDIDFSFMKSKKDVPEHLNLSTGLGCPRDCYFCGLVHGDVVRQWSANKIISVIRKYEERLIELGLGDGLASGKYMIRFIDDDFFIDKKRAMEFMTRYAALLRRGEAQLRVFSMQTSLRTLLKSGERGRYEVDQRIIDVISANRDVFYAGKPFLMLGTDAFDDMEIERLNKGRPGRAYTFEDVKRTVESLAEAGIANVHYLILTNPETSHKDLASTAKNILSLIREHNRTFVISPPNFFVIPEQNNRIYMETVEKGDHFQARGTYYLLGGFWEYELLEGDCIVPQKLGDSLEPDEQRKFNQLIGQIDRFTSKRFYGNEITMGDEIDYERGMAGLYEFYARHSMYDRYQALWGVTDGNLDPGTILGLEEASPELLNFMLIQNKDKRLTYEELVAVYKKIIEDSKGLSLEEYAELLWLLDTIHKAKFLVVDEWREPYRQFSDFLADEKAKREMDLSNEASYRHTLDVLTEGCEWRIPGELLAGNVGEVPGEELLYPDGVNIGLYNYAVPGLEMLVKNLMDKKLEGVNFLFMLPDAYMTDGEPDNGGVYSRNAVFVNKEGKLAYGRFTEPVRLDGFVHGGTDLESQEYFTERGVSLFTPTEIIRLCMHKIDAKQLMTWCGIRTAPAEIFDKDAPGNIGDRLREFISRTGAKEVVIKPDRGYQADGVVIRDSDQIGNIVEDIVRLLGKDIRDNKGVLVEKRIESNEFTDESGQRYDWNMRVLATWDGDDPVVEPGMVLVSYSPYGKDPVNESKGAKFMMLDEFFDKKKYSSVTRGAFIQKIKDAISFNMLKIKEARGVKPGIIGWDIIEDPDGNLNVLEMNGVNVSLLAAIESRMPDDKKGDLELKFGKYLKQMGEQAKNATRDQVDLGFSLRKTIPEDNFLLYWAGNAYASIGQRGLAIKMWEKALEVKSGDNRSRWNLSQALMDEKRYQDAERISNELIDADGKGEYIEAGRILGRALYEQKRYGESEKALKAYLKKSGEQAEALTYLGLIMNHKARYMEAKGYFMAALSKGAKNSVAWLGLIDAVNADRQPDSTITFTALAYIALNEKRIEDASSHAQKAMELDPGNEVAAKLSKIIEGQAREARAAKNAALLKEADGLVEQMRSARVNGLMNLPAIIGKYLESLPKEKAARPISIDVDISLFRGGEEAIKGDISAWASLMLQCAALKNVSFTFDMPDPLHDGSMPESISAIREKIPSKSRVLEELKRKISEQAALKGIDPEKFFSERVNTPGPAEVIIPICDGIWLEWLSEKGLDNPIGENEYPVAIDAGNPVENMNILNNYQAALSIGLAKAALAIAAEGFKGEDLELEYLANEGNILKKMNELYKLIRPDVEITMDTLRYMVSKNARTRLNRAIELFIPPVIKWSESVVELQEKVNLYLGAA